MLWQDCKLMLDFVGVKDGNVRVMVFVNDDLVCKVLILSTSVVMVCLRLNKMCELKAKGKIFDIPFIVKHHMTWL